MMLHAIVLITMLWSMPVYAAIIFSENLEDQQWTDTFASNNPGLCCSYSGTLSSTIKKAGNFALRLENRSTDPDTNLGANRAELPRYNLHAKVNVERWYGFSVYIDPSWDDSTSDPNATLIFQIHGPSSVCTGGSPQFSIGVKPNLNWAITTLYQTSCPSSPVTRINHSGLGTVTKGVWYDYVVHGRWRADSTGLLEVWRNGVKIVDYSGPNTYNDTTQARMGVAVYKSWWASETPSPADTLILYYDEIKMGDQNSSFNEVAPGGGADTTPPGPPGTPSWSTVSASRIDGSWTSPGGGDLAGYTIGWCQNAGCTVTTGPGTCDVGPNRIDVGLVTSYQHTGLFASTTYGHRISARDTSNNCSAFSTIEYDATSAGAAPALLTHWDMNDGSGFTMTDVENTGTDYNGTLCQGTTCGSGTGPTWVAGELSGAISCDGVDDNVEVAHAAALDLTGNLTIAFWFKLLSTTNIFDSPNTAALLTKSGGAGTPYHISIMTTAAPNFRWFHTGSGLTFTAYTLPVNADWTHAAITRDTATSSLKLYIGGNVTQSLTYPAAPTASAAAIRLCANPDRSLYANIALDDVRIYDGLLADTAIAALAVGNPGVTGVFAQPSNGWRWRGIDSTETGTFQRLAGAQGRMVVQNQARLRTQISRTVDTSALTAFALYCRVPAGSGATEDWWALNEDCIGHRFCYGTDQWMNLVGGDVSTTAQLVSAGAFTTGGKLYQSFTTRSDQVSIAAATSIEREHVLRARSDVTVGTTVGCCERVGDGTTLNSCDEATASIVAPGAFAR